MTIKKVFEERSLQAKTIKNAQKIEKTDTQTKISNCALETFQRRDLTLGVICLLPIDDMEKIELIQNLLK